MFYTLFTRKEKQQSVDEYLLLSRTKADVHEPQSHKTLKDTRWRVDKYITIQTRRVPAAVSQ